MWRRLQQAIGYRQSPVRRYRRRSLRLEQLEDRTVPSNFNEFTAGITSGSQPTSIVRGGDGNFWFTEFNNNALGRITPSGTVTEFSLASLGAAIGPLDIVSDAANGLLYFTDRNSGTIGSINPLAGSNALILASETQSAVVPSGAGAGVNGITVGPEGNLWFTELSVDRIGNITPNLATINEFAGLTAGAAPANIVTGPDNALWFTETNTNASGAIGRITTAGTVTNEFALSGTDNDPEDIAAGPDGALWFTNAGSDQIGRITTAGAISTVQLTLGSIPQGITSGPFGALYFAEAGRDLIGQITTAGSVAEFGAGMIAAGSQPTDVTVSGNHIWFTEASSSHSAIGQIAPDAPLTAQGVNISATAGVSFTQMVATFQDADTTAVPSDFTIAINWGDGTALDTTSGQVFAVPGQPGSFTVSGSHSFAAAGSFNVSVTITDVNTTTSVGGSVATANAVATVSAPPVPPPFVSEAFGPSGEVIELVNSAGQLTQFDATGAHVLGGGVRSASVAFNAGSEVLLVTFQTGALMQFDATGAHLLGSSGTQSASVAFGPFGEVIEAVNLNGTLTQFDATGAHVLGGGVQTASVAFGPAGEVLAVVSPTGTLTQFDSSGAHVLGGGVLSAGVAFDASGSEVLDVIFQNGTLIQFDAAGTHVLGPVAVAASAASTTTQPGSSGAAPQSLSPAQEIAGTDKINDLYVFQSPSNANNTVLILDFQAFPGVLTPTTTDPTQTYDIHIDNSNPLNGIEDLTFRITYGAPNSNGVQPVTLRELPTADAPPNGIVAQGETGQNIPIFGGTGMFRTAIQSDPSFIDQGAFNNLYATGDTTQFPRPVGQAKNFYGPNVNTFSIIIEVPSTRLTPVANGIIGVWATIDKNGVQLDRMGRPLIDEALIPPVPRNNLSLGDEQDAFNAGLPRNDVANFKAGMVSVLTNPNFIFKESAATANTVANLLLPDILPFQIGNASGYGTFIGPGGEYLGNGRHLTDPVVDTTLSILTGGAITTDNVNDDNGFRITDGSIEPVSGKARSIAFPYIGAPFIPLNGPGTAPNP